MVPVVMHLDMNSYFASVEQQDNPAWRGKPVGVCEHLGGIIIAASVEAKRWGISTGTPVWEAKKIYPKIHLSPTHPDRYRMYTRRLVKLVEQYTDSVELYSIDEVFLDLTRVCNIRLPRASFRFPEGRACGQCRDTASLREFFLAHRQELSQADPFEEAERIGKEIKARMKREVGDYLRCSIGIAENKLVAKIASDLKKPDGLTVIRPEDKDMLYSRLSLTDIPGIGKRQERNLNSLGIYSLRDLKEYPLSKLVARFGLPGYHLHAMGQLESSFKPEVDGDGGIKSMGHMYTLPKEFRDRRWIEPVLYKLSEMVARRLRRKNLAGNMLFFHLHDDQHACFGRGRRLKNAIHTGADIYAEAKSILGELNVDAARFRLVGVTVAGLRPKVGQQSLFRREERLERVEEAIGDVNDKYGDFTLCHVPARLAGAAFHDSVGFGRVRELEEDDC